MSHEAFFSSVRYIAAVINHCSFCTLRVTTSFHMLFIGVFLIISAIVITWSDTFTAWICSPSFALLSNKQFITAVRNNTTLVIRLHCLSDIHTTKHSPISVVSNVQPIAQILNKQCMQLCRSAWAYFSKCLVGTPCGWLAATRSLISIEVVDALWPIVCTPEQVCFLPSVFQCYSLFL
jgi:hypothetical protein